MWVEDVEYFFINRNILLLSICFTFGVFGGIGNKIFDLKSLMATKSGVRCVVINELP